MNPQKLIMTMLAAYESFDSYSDVGKCTPDSADTIGPLDFQTFFKRPDKFHFQWSSSHPRSGTTTLPKQFALWTNGTKFKHQYFSKTEDAVDLSMLVAGATGISRSSVNKILTILLPKCLKMQHYWHDMTDIRNLEDEAVNGLECYHLQGMSKTVNDVEIWIEKSSLLIRRIKEKLVITEEDCRKMNDYLQSENQWQQMVEKLTATMQETGLNSDEIEKKFLLLKEKRRPMKPSSNCYTFDYTTVQVNEPIQTELFESL